jgi:hypothetical protein
MLRYSRLFSALLPVLGAVLLSFTSSSALDIITIGQNGELDWYGEGSTPVTPIDPQLRSPLDPNKLVVTNAPGELVQFESAEYPRGILPKKIEEGANEGANIAVGTILRGGTIKAPNVTDFGRQIGVASGGIFDRNDLRLALEELLTDDDGGEREAFERKNYNSLGTLVILNLGGSFGVNRIRFYPRNTVVESPATPYQTDFLRAFELYINDGSSFTKDGSIIWSPILLETDNESPIVDVALDPPRYVQSVRIRATSTVDFEIDEIEVYGTGYLSKALYVSDIYDAGQPALWGKLRWVEEAIGNPTFSSLQIRTRTGSDESPFVFTRRLGGKRDAEEIPYSLQNPTQEMDLDEYQTLPQRDASDLTWEPGPVKDDLVNWSPYSTPYPASAANGPGIDISSPSPRRYFQFQVSFQSNDLEAARLLKSLSFEMLSPPFADQIIGEVFPREAVLAEATDFTYAVRPVMETTSLRGFDTIEIFTPVEIENVNAIEILDSQGEIVAEHAFSDLDDSSDDGQFRIESVASDKFVVRFPFVEEDDALVRIHFRTQVLTYSTNFTAAVRISDEAEMSQTIISGNAASLSVDDNPDLSGTTVLSPSVLSKERLLDQVAAVPAVFSPNGDQINDAATIRYNLLSLDVPRPVTIGIYDLSGYLARTVFSGEELNGRYDDKVWDGRNDQGELVPPGLYIVRIAIEGDSQQDEQSRTVGVAY